eukprot:gnl/MRDRNA2_/MRDRNA2_56922_c0_seq1.p1 gnl/MRDRNA2_/MRDRNA2_56922_c0~~gnl/MRDRNA2_/MRDRNA2_56922_c0_seq1.p1  ORF type:complete len:640 (-),score=146.47 gnl/MRDRNA2_/MRDRNA2_56922_c0_seq1:40-1959(-)
MKCSCVMLRERSACQSIMPEDTEKCGLSKGDNVEVEFLCEKFSGVLKQVKIEQQLRSDVEVRRKSAASTHTASVAALEAEVQSLCKQLAGREECLQTLEAQCVELQAEIISCSNEEDSVGQPTSEEAVKAELRAEQEEQKRCASSMQQLHEVLAHAKTEAADWQNRYLQQMHRADSLQEQLQTRENCFAAAEDAVRCQQRDLQQTLRRLAEERSQAEALGTQLQAAQRETRTLGERLSAVRTEFSRREGALKCSQRDCRLLESMVAEFRASTLCAAEEVEASQLQLASERSVAEEEAALAQKEREFQLTVEAQCRQWEREAQSLEEQRFESEAMEVDLRSELSALASELASVHEEDVSWLDRESVLGQELVQARASCAELKAEVFALQPRLAAMKYEEASHTRCLSSLQNRHAELLRIIESSDRHAKERRWRELRARNSVTSCGAKPRDARLRTPVQQVCRGFASPAIASDCSTPADSVELLRCSQGSSSPSHVTPNAPESTESPQHSVSSFGRTPSRALQYLQDFVAQEERRLHVTEGEENSFVFDVSASPREAETLTLDISDTILSTHSDGKENCNQSKSCKPHVAETSHPPVHNVIQLGKENSPASPTRKLEQFSLQKEDRKEGISRGRPLAEINC